MARDGLLIGEVARRSGASRKALRLYEDDALALLAFVRQAQRLGFSLDEIKDIVAIRRAGRAPCPHVHALVRRKTDELDQRLSDLMTVREGLRALLNGWRTARKTGAIVCPHIERPGHSGKGRR